MPESATPIRVAVVDDHAVVVLGVAGLLAPYPERVTVVEPGGGATAGDVDVVLYDSFAAARGTDLVTLARGGTAKVVVFSWSTEPALVARVLDQGAAGYVPKSSDGAQLVAAIEAVAAGEVVVPSDHVAQAAPGAWPGQAHGLTAREASVLSLITQGLSNQEIADHCYLSINSVKTYIRTAYRKMGVTRRSQAVLWGLAHGFSPHAEKVAQSSSSVSSTTAPTPGR